MVRPPMMSSTYTVLVSHARVRWPIRVGFAISSSTVCEQGGSEGASDGMHTMPGKLGGGERVRDISSARARSARLRGRSTQQGRRWKRV
eukprot:125664-Prorocentrum_minimum.AAC.1